jgi:hypothetical protein
VYVDLAECWTRWHAREESQTWRGMDGCELRPEAELELAHRTGVGVAVDESLCAKVVMMRRAKCHEKAVLLE